MIVSDSISYPLVDHYCIVCESIYVAWLRLYSSHMPFRILDGVYIPAGGSDEDFTDAIIYYDNTEQHPDDLNNDDVFILYFFTLHICAHSFWGHPV